jgi:hypothetical protein
MPPEVLAKLNSTLLTVGTETLAVKRSSFDEVLNQCIIAFDEIIAGIPVALGSLELVLDEESAKFESFSRTGSRPGSPAFCGKDCLYGTRCASPQVVRIIGEGQPARGHIAGLPFSRARLISASPASHQPGRGDDARFPRIFSGCSISASHI